MSAQELRQAAETLRERARLATEGSWHRWRDIDGAFFTVGDEAGVLTPERPFTEECNPVAQVYTDSDADYIATMHPGVGLALADWLDATAERVDAGRPRRQGGRSNHSWRGSREALRVARLVNGGAS